MKKKSQSFYFLFLLNFICWYPINLKSPQGFLGFSYTSNSNTKPLLNKLDNFFEIIKLELEKNFSVKISPEINLLLDIQKHYFKILVTKDTDAFTFTDNLSINDFQTKPEVQEQFVTTLHKKVIQIFEQEIIKNYFNNSPDEFEKITQEFYRLFTSSNTRMQYLTIEMPHLVDEMTTLLPQETNSQKIIPFYINIFLYFYLAYALYSCSHFYNNVCSSFDSSEIKWVCVFYSILEKICRAFLLDFYTRNITGISYHKLKKYLKKDN